MVTKNWLFFVFFLAVTLGVYAVTLPGKLQIANPKNLNETLIKELFSEQANDQSSKPGLEKIRWARGSFTEAKAIEAVVSFYDPNQCHACGWSQIWLLRFDGRWKVDRKLANGDTVSFRVVDIDMYRDGKSEIWIEEGGGNQGAFSSRGRLLSLDHSASTIMYSNIGFDNYGAGAEGEAVRTHAVEFRDLDHDGILEILDLQQSKFYHWMGEKWESDWPSDYVQTGFASHMTVLKLKGSVFKEVNLSGSK